jgi:hypothetical protein
MPASETVPDIVATKGAKKNVAPPTVPVNESNTVFASRALLWVAVLLIGGATLIPIAGFASRELKTLSLIHADAETVRTELSSTWPRRASAAWLETLAELGLEIEPQEPEHSMQAAARATTRDPSRAGAWALQAYLETGKAKQVNAVALEALSKSMAACPLCNEELVRWRFNFVLANWASIPDDMRRKAFEQADILRWMGDNGEFLAEMRIKSKQAGIPFDEYRSAVNTPVRTWDLEPVEAKGTASANAGG